MMQAYYVKILQKIYRKINIYFDVKELWNPHVLSFEDNEEGNFDN